MPIIHATQPNKSVMGATEHLEPHCTAKGLMTSTQSSCQSQLSACVFSGGLSRRMGQDKALLIHRSHLSWLEHISGLLLKLECPVQVLTRHPEHQQQLRRLPAVRVVMEAPPWRGPLQAMARVLPRNSSTALFTAPVDMPELELCDLEVLLEAWRENTQLAVIASDGERLQPLLGIYPGGIDPHRSMLEVLRHGTGRWMDWLELIPHRSVRLPARRLLNCNRPGDLNGLHS